MAGAVAAGGDDRRTGDRSTCRSRAGTRVSQRGAGVARGRTPGPTRGVTRTTSTGRPRRRSGLPVPDRRVVPRGERAVRRRRVRRASGCSRCARTPPNSSTSAPRPGQSVRARGSTRRAGRPGRCPPPSSTPGAAPTRAARARRRPPTASTPDRREEEREPHLDGRVVDDALPEDRDHDDVHGVRGQRERPDGRQRGEGARPPVGDDEARRRSRAARRRRCRRPRTWSTSAARRSPARRASRAGAARPTSRRARGPRARGPPARRGRAAAWSAGRCGRSRARPAGTPSRRSRGSSGRR